LGYVVELNLSITTSSNNKSYERSRSNAGMHGMFTDRWLEACKRRRAGTCQSTRVSGVHNSEIKAGNQYERDLMHGLTGEVGHVVALDCLLSIVPLLGVPSTWLSWNRRRQSEYTFAPCSAHLSCHLLPNHDPVQNKQQQPCGIGVVNLLHRTGSVKKKTEPNSKPELTWPAPPVPTP
jgi:hypothetical protein